jgi:hypothetical protein
MTTTRRRSVSVSLRRLVSEYHSVLVTESYFTTGDTKASRLPVALLCCRTTGEGQWYNVLQNVQRHSRLYDGGG